MSLQDLTPGAIDQMVNHFDSEDKLDGPVCQVISIKKLPASQPNGQERYRIILSDGFHYCQSMLAMQMKPLIDDGTVSRNCLVRINDYASNHVQARRILILLNLEKYADPTADRLGTPQNIDSVKETAAEPAEPAAKPTSRTASTGAATSKSTFANRTSNGNGNSTSNYKSSSVKPEPNAGGGSSSRKSGGTKSGLPIYPIEGLSPYQNKWTIRARVTQKGDIKHFTNKNGPGKLFSVNFLDESSEIRATGFGDEVDRFYNLLQENKVYFVSKAKVVLAKKQFNPLGKEYELTFSRDTEIEECEDASDVPQVQYSFVPFDQLEAVEVNQLCDVIGVIENVGEVGEIITKSTQKPIKKRELNIADSTGMSVRITLWGKTAENFRLDSDEPVAAFKGVRVGDFGGRSLSMLSSSTMAVEPDLPEAFALRGWWDTEGKKGGLKTFSSGGGGGGGGAAGSNLAERRTIEQVKDEELGMNNSDKPDFFNMRASLVYVKSDNLWYAACPSESGCQKKVTYEGSGWRCERCDRSFEAPNYRYIMTANVADHTGQMWISCFNEVAEEILGATAKELFDLKEESGDTEYQSYVKRCAGRMYLFNCRAKQDTFNDQTRVRYTVSKMAPTDFVREGNLLAEAIEKYL